MNPKTLKALLLGYVVFDVNGALFLSYARASRHAHEIKDDVLFKGFSPFCGWRCFLIRDTRPIFLDATT